VKHSLFLKLGKEIKAGLKKGLPVSVECGCLSLTPFVFEAISLKKIFVLDSPEFNEALGFFDINSSSFAAIPKPLGLLPAKGFASFNRQLLNLGINKCSYAWGEIDVCLVDKKSLHDPLFYEKTKTVGFSFKGEETRDSFIKNILKIGYAQKTSIVDQGDYVVRGGIVDVFSYGLLEPVRISFLDERATAYSINKEDGFVSSPMRGVFFPPKKTTKETSIYKKGLLEKVIFVKHKNKKLLFNYQSKKTTKRIVFYKSLVNYNIYKKTRKKGCFYSPFLQKTGFLVDQKTVVVPAWYKKEPAAAEGGVYVSKMTPGHKYIHEKFGVCRFVGVDISVDNVEKMCLEFRDGKIKVDVSLVGCLFYLGDENNKQPLSFLSRRGVWRRTKKRYSLMAQDFVESVYLVYKKRKTTTRAPCVLNNDLNFLFNQTFPHKATAGQKKCVEEVFSDLSSPYPMTRLLCGDVGFGKTEVALRSVFCASYNKKKSIVVAPTKILKDQIYNVFNERFALFGVSVFSSVSSFLNSKDLGSVLVSSHKVLNMPEPLSVCSFLIVDEEHRFGVLQKENIILKNPLSDVLYMSATPLPRSLQMSLSNARPISIIKTPPLAKKQILTHVYSFNKTLIKAVVLNEISRSGQVFIVDKSVVCVKKLHKTIVDLFPSVPSAVLYSSLSFSTIQKTMRKFRNNKIQILVSTTIIESGIDVGNANTIIINNADFFGLSQLYQMRGRVGRGPSQAHAYLLLSNKQTPSALMRLRSLVKHQSLGSGYSVAFDDLKIRGAGSVFGYKQSGGSGVGFEFYSKLVGDALRFSDGGGVELSPLVVVGEAFIPPSIIPSSVDRIRAYKTIADCRSVSLLLSFYSRFVSFLNEDCFPFYCLVKNKQVQILLEKTCIYSVVLSGRSLFIKINKGSFFYNKDFVLSLNSLLIKHKPLTTANNEGFEYKIQFKKSVKDCYIFIINLLEFLDDKK